MSREVWVPVEDKAAWARADTTGDVTGATVVLKRRDNGAEITLPQAEFAKLALTTYSEMDDVVDDINVPGVPQVKGLKNIFKRSNRKVRATVNKNYKILLKLNA